MVRDPLTSNLEEREPIDADERRDVELRPSSHAIELRHLRYFLAVYEELHFGRGAARLHIAQPPLSQAIRKLECELGVQLLRRTSRSVQPTDAGRVFAEEARRVLAALDVAVARARHAGGIESPLRIGCVPYLPMESLLQFLGALDARLPRLPTQLTHLLTSEQIALLQTGELDLGILPATDGHEDIEQEPIFSGPDLSAFLPAGHPLAAKDAVTPADVLDETLVMFPAALNPALQPRILALLDNSGYRFRGLHEASGVSSRDVLLAVAEGFGVAIGPFAAQDIDDPVVVRRPLHPTVRMPDTVLAWRAGAAKPLHASLEVACEIARGLRATEIGA